MNFSLYQIPRYVIINFILEPIQGRNCLSTRHHSWKTGFDSRSGHAENLKNDTCGLSSLVLRVDGRVHGNSSRAVLPLTRHQCAFTVKAGAWPAAQASGDVHCRLLVKLRKEYRNWV